MTKKEFIIKLNPYKFEVGYEVKFKKDLVAGRRYGHLSLLNLMLQYIKKCDYIGKITYITASDSFQIEGSNFIYTKEMMED